MIEEYINLISNVGFPIAMCFYLIFRFERKITENTKVLNRLLTVINSKFK